MWQVWFLLAQIFIAATHQCSSIFKIFFFEWKDFQQYSIPFLVFNQSAKADCNQSHISFQ